MNNQNQPIYIAPNEYLDKKSAAALLGVSTRSLENWARAGKLRVSKVTHQTWRVKRSELEEMLDRHSTLPAE
jgi:excisionase family DNA binding protein